MFDGKDVTDEAAGPDHGARRRAHVPEHPPVRHDVGGGERARRPARAPARVASSARSSARRASAQRGARRAARSRASCSSTPASAAAASTTPPPTSPTATSAGSRSRARWRRIPKLLLLDEPTAGMNPQETEQLTGFMRKLRDERELAILLIEHDMKVVMGVSEQVTVLDHGEKIAEGEPQEVRNDPQGRRGLSRKAGLSDGCRCSKSRTSTPPTARSRRSRASR